MRLGGQSAYGEDTVKDARSAYREFGEANASLSGYLWSFVSAPKPYADHLSIIPAKNALPWFNWIERTEQPDKKFTRADLLDAGMSDQLIDKLLAERTGRFPAGHHS